MELDFLVLLELIKSVDPLDESLFLILVRGSERLIIVVNLIELHGISLLFVLRFFHVVSEGLSSLANRSDILVLCDRQSEDHRYEDKGLHLFFFLTWVTSFSQSKQDYNTEAMASYKENQQKALTLLKTTLKFAKEEKNAKPVTALELALGESTEEVDKDIDKHTEQPSSDKLSEQDIESLHVQDTESTSSKLEEKLEQEIEPISESEIENVFGQDDALKNHQEDEQEPKKEIEVDLQYEVNDSKQLERDDPSDKKVVEKSVEKLQTELKTPPIEESKQAPTLADFLADSTENPSTDSSNTNNKQ